MTEPGFMPPRIEEVETPDVLTDALRFHRAMEIDTVGIILFSPNGDIFKANKAFLRMTGYTEAEVQAGKLQWTAITPPEWRPASERALAQFRTSGSVSPYEKQYLRKDGTRFWVLIASKRLSKDEGITFVLDISERKRAETELQLTQAQLERSDSQLQMTMDAVPTMIAHVDPWLRYIRVNRAYAKFFGVQPEGVVGRPMRDILQADYAQVESAMERALAGETQQVEGVFQAAIDGGRQTVAQYIPDVTQEGHLLGIVIQATDVTERRKAEHLLRTAEKLAAVGRLAASMAHEINNPLEAVMNLLYLARTSEPEGTRRYLEQADAELRRVAAITNQTLRFHKQATRPVAVQADDLIQSVLSMYAARLLNGHVEVRQRMRAAEPVICFDGEIRQLLSNLVSNALDAMSGRTAHLTVRSAPATDWKTGRHGVRWTVADTGTGMSPETIARLWEPFFTTKEIGGTGLGLWISLDIAERHGGRLRVRSCPGMGSLFSFWIPLQLTATD